MSAPLPIVARYEGEGLFQALGRSKRARMGEVSHRYSLPSNSSSQGRTLHSKSDSSSRSSS